MKTKDKVKGITLLSLVLIVGVIIVLSVAIIIKIFNAGTVNSKDDSISKPNEAPEVEEKAISDYEKYMENNLEEKTSETETPLKTWTWEDSNNDSEKSIGDILTDKVGEKFYIISVSEKNYELLAQKGLDINTMSQSDDPSTIKFSSTPYWGAVLGDINNIEPGSDTDVIAIARKYGISKGGKGRLITYNEVNALKDDYSSIIYGKIKYWISYAHNDYYIGHIRDSKICLNEVGYNKEGYLVIRPVVIIPKSKIS